MIAATIGISSGLLIILLIALIKSLDKPILYGLILSGIGFLYVGFTWTDLHSVFICAIQAIFFVFFALYGTKNMNVLALGFFAHGLWDLAYTYFQSSNLLPPHYDIFCFTIDFTLGIYLLGLNYLIVHRIRKEKVS